MAKTAPPEAKKMIGGGLQVSSSGERAASGKKHVREIHTKKAKGGGHVVSHHYDNSGMGPFHNSVDHVFGKDDGVKHMKHYMRHAGVTGVKVSPAGAGDASDNDADDKD